MNRHAFTIIEIIMGIVIIAILATIVIPKFIDIRNDAIERSEEYTIGAVREAIQQSYARSLIRDAIPVYPPYLDNEITAQLGAASSQNPLFNAVLTGVITQWELLAMAPEESWYRGPTGTDYQYNPLTGTITAGVFAGGGGGGGEEGSGEPVTWAYPSISSNVIPFDQIDFGGESADILRRDEAGTTVGGRFTAQDLLMNMGNPATTGEPGLYGADGQDDARFIIETSDGGYLVVGDSRSFYTGEGYDNETYVMKMDVNGNLVWSQTYVQPGLHPGYDRAYTAVETPDGGCIIGGYISIDGSPNASLIKVDANGNLDNGWSKIYGSGQFQDIKMTYDAGNNPDGYIVSGTLGGGNVSVVKLDLDGNVIWDKSEVSNSIAYGTTIQETPDGDYIITGSTMHLDEGNDTDALVMRVSSDGNLMWKNRYGVSQADYAQDVTVSSDGNLLVAISSSTDGGDPYLTKIDSNTGDVLWSRTYGDNAYNNVISIDTTADGRVVMIGSTRAEDGSYQAYLMSLNEDGEIDGDSTLSIISDTEGPDYDWIQARSAQQTSDGGYAITGYYGLGPDADYCVIKVDSQGNIN